MFHSLVSNYCPKCKCNIAQHGDMCILIYVDFPHLTRPSCTKISLRLLNSFVLIVLKVWVSNLVQLISSWYGREDSIKLFENYANSLVRCQEENYVGRLGVKKIMLADYVWRKTLFHLLFMQKQAGCHCMLDIRYA